MLQHMQVCNYRVYIFVRILSRFYRLSEFEFNKKAEFAPFGGGEIQIKKIKAPAGVLPCGSIAFP